MTSDELGLGPGSKSRSWVYYCEVVFFGSSCNGSSLFVVVRRWRGKRVLLMMSSSMERRLVIMAFCRGGDNEVVIRGVVVEIINDIKVILYVF